MNKLKEKIKLNPIMTYIILILIVICLSGFLSLVGFEATYNKINGNGEFTTTLVSVESLLSLSGIKYIFSSTVANFVSFTPLSMLIIVLIGIGIMEKSGFLKTAFTLLTKFCQRKTVTFIWVLINVLISIAGDLGFVAMIPLGALLFSYGRRNPIVGIVSTFAALTCGTGISLFFTSVDSSLLTTTLESAHIIDAGYGLKTFVFIFIMLVAVVLVSAIITLITEKTTVHMVEKYEFKEEKREFRITKREVRGMLYSLIAGLVYLLIFIYNIIPGLPFSGNLLDNSQVFYIDKLFSYDSFFSNGFVFIITMLFVILGLFYGIGAKTIKNNNDFCDDLSHSLDGIGKILVSILFASVLLNVIKKSNIGSVFAAYIANIIEGTSFTGIPLIILVFVLNALATILLPTSQTRWAILAGSVVPVFMSAGLSPEFAQIIIRFSESMTMGITPVFAYFVIYLAYIEKYNQSDTPISVFTTLKYQLPFCILIGIALLALLIIWYISGIPIGINGVVAI